MPAGAVDEQFHAINPEVAAWSESYYFVRKRHSHTAAFHSPAPSLSSLGLPAALNRPLLPAELHRPEDGPGDDDADGLPPE